MSSPAKAGHLAGTIWRKIVCVETGKTYPSFNQASKDGFDVEQLVKPRDVD